MTILFWILAGMNLVTGVIGLALNYSFGWGCVSGAIVCAFMASTLSRLDQILRALRSQKYDGAANQEVHDKKQSGVQHFLSFLK